MKLAGVMLGTQNAKRLGDFYTKLFGAPGWHDGEWYGFMIGSATMMIGPHSEVGANSAEPARVIISFESSDVESDFEKVKACGAGVVAEPYQPSPKDNPTIWLATLSDPDGNYLQIATPWQE